ncbi:MAG: hypothetical protein EYC70_16985 [Planctomycetota bacterium]|nr:MAG: hypothetical protein EYC70_16985 [Planctomycetota bacterium]
MARLAAGPRQRLTLFVVALFAVTALGVICQRDSDPVLRVETFAAGILHAAAEAGLEDPFLLAGLVYAESRGNPAAVSSTGAQGLCQLVPSTAAELAALHQIPGPPFTPQDNLRLGAWYLAELQRRWHGDTDLALLSYRLGPNKVAREVAAAGGADAWKAQIQQQLPGPWDHRNEVLRARALFRQRAASGVGWPERARVLAQNWAAGGPKE